MFSLQTIATSLNDTATDHDWWVFSTCIGTIELMLICHRTDAEWDEAFEAPNTPYRWPASKRGRVVVKWPTDAHTLLHTEETRRLWLMGDRRVAESGRQ